MRSSAQLLAHSEQTNDVLSTKRSVCPPLWNVLDALGNQQQALEYYQQALTIWREVGDRGGEGVTQWAVGALALDQHHYDLALAAFFLARQCFEEVSSPHQHEVEEWVAALYQEVGQEQFVALRARVEPQARQLFEQAL